MGRIAIVTDSNSGITQAQAAEYGITVLPMPFYINEELYFEEINLTQEEFYTKLEEGAEISTSQPAAGDVLELWDSLLKEYEEIVYIPMSSGLSGSCETAVMLSKDYDGRVQVVNNQRISVTQRRSVLDALDLAAAGHSAEKIREILEREKFHSTIYITLSTLYYLKKGGRLTPAAAALGTALRLKPVLQIQGERLDTFSIARTVRQGEDKMLNALEQDINNRFGGMDNLDNIHIDLAYTDDCSMAQHLAERAQERFGIREYHMDPLSLSVACHIGPGAYAITATLKTPKE